MHYYSEAPCKTHTAGHKSETTAEEKSHVYKFNENYCNLSPFLTTSKVYKREQKRKCSKMA